MNTIFYYMYRDADNYKNHGEIPLKGEMTEAQKQIILDRCPDGMFIAAQIGIDSLHFKEDTGADHCWNEIEGFGETTSETCDYTVEEFVKLFSDVRYWDDMRYAV